MEHNNSLYPSIEKAPSEASYPREMKNSRLLSYGERIKEIYKVEVCRSILRILKEVHYEGNLVIVVDRKA